LLLLSVLVLTIIAFTLLIFLLLILLKAMVDESYRLLSVLQHDQSVAAARAVELQDYAMGIKDTKAEMEQALTFSNAEKERLAKENTNISELYKIASNSLRDGSREGLWREGGREREREREREKERERERERERVV
jgi:hypothetical protein